MQATFKFDQIRCIDFFCGGGGMTEAARQAGLVPVFAANHWQVAVDSHRLNHPETTHVVQDLMLYDMSKIPAHDVFLASPSCQGFTRARGKDRPHHDALRTTMWCVVSCAEMHRQPLVIVENVTDVLKWSLWPAWKLAMESLGYHVCPHIVDAADQGVPQRRERVFIACSLNRQINAEMPKLDHVPVRNFIDWDYSRWSPINKPGRSQKRLAQIEAGRQQHGDRFLIPYYGSGSGLIGRSVDRPCGTLVAHDIWAVVDGDRMRMLQPHEYQTIMGFPEDYQFHGTRREKIRMLGNAVCPPSMSEFIKLCLGA